MGQVLERYSHWQAEDRQKAVSIGTCLPQHTHFYLARLLSINSGDVFSCFRGRVWILTHSLHECIFYPTTSKAVTWCDPKASCLETQRPGRADSFTLPCAVGPSLEVTAFCTKWSARPMWRLGRWTRRPPNAFDMWESAFCEMSGAPFLCACGLLTCLLSQKTGNSSVKDNKICSARPLTNTYFMKLALTK